MDAELVLVVEWRVGRVLAAPVAEYMPEDRGGVGVVFVRLGERLGLSYT